MQRLSLQKRAIRTGLRMFVFACLASVVPLSQASACRPARLHEINSTAYHGEVHVIRSVTSSVHINARDPYHLPDSYNYDWPYGEGLSH